MLRSDKYNEYRINIPLSKPTWAHDRLVPQSCLWHRKPSCRRPIHSPPAQCSLSCLCFICLALRNKILTIILTQIWAKLSLEVKTAEILTRHTVSLSLSLSPFPSRDFEFWQQSIYISHSTTIYVSPNGDVMSGSHFCQKNWVAWLLFSI